MGHRKFDHKLDYYQDHGDAFCYEKKVQVAGKAGAASALLYADDRVLPAARLVSWWRWLLLIASVSSLARKKLLWREATTVFMTGHGGWTTGWRLVFIIAALRQRFLLTLIPRFIQGVRVTKRKKKVIELVQQDFEEQLHTNKILKSLTQLQLWRYQKYFG